MSPWEQNHPRLETVVPPQATKRAAKFSEGGKDVQFGFRLQMLGDPGKTAPPLWASHSPRPEVREDPQGRRLERRNHALTPRLLGKPQQRTGMWGGGAQLRRRHFPSRWLSSPLLYSRVINQRQQSKSRIPAGCHLCKIASGFVFVFSLRRKICGWSNF